MKHLVLTLLLLLPIATIFAQPNSVTLKDGAGNVIGIHNSIQAAYDAIPGTLTQAYTIEIEASYNGADESYPVTFINKMGASALNTITVVPAASVTNWKIISAGSDTSSIFLLDDADWMIIGNTNFNSPEIRFVNNAQGSVFPMVHLINGSCHNLIVDCTFISYDVGTTAIGIKLGSSSTNATGNSDNSIENGHFTLCGNGIVSEGTFANRNRRNRIYRMTFTTVYRGIYLGEGAGSTTIDSCLMQTQLILTGENNQIVAEHLDDSLFVRNNRLKLYGHANSGNLKCLSVSNTTGEDGYVSAINNFFVMDEGIDLLATFEDSVHEVFCMLFEGTGNVRADIYHNTVRVRGKYEGGGVVGALNSAAFRKTSTSAGNVFNIRNNLFLNERVDSSAGMQHLAMSIPQTAGTINMNHNTYAAPGSELITYGNTTYTSFAAYQAAIGGGNEANSNTAFVEFESPADYRLYASAVNNPALQGVLLPEVPIDFEIDARSYPYRGCDEYVITCGNGTGAQLSLPLMPVCYGTMIQIQCSDAQWGNGHYYQWQSRPTGSGLPFADIPGYTHTIEFPIMYESTDYRVKDSCALGSPVLISQVGTVNVLPLPTVNGINVNNLGWTYDFSADNPQNVTGYQWDFGDNSPIDTDPSPDHTYGDTGTYTVTLIVTNNCGSDTVTINVNPVSVRELAKEEVQVKVYPNPANGFVTVQSAEMLKEIKMYDVTGKQVTSITSNTTKHSIDISQLSQGYYMMHVVTDRGIAHKPLNILR